MAGEGRGAGGVPGGPEAAAAAAGVVAAANAKDSKLLKPLSDRCTVRGPAPELFPLLDAIVADRSWQVVAHRVELKRQGRALVTFVAA